MNKSYQNIILGSLFLLAAIFIAQQDTPISISKTPNPQLVPIDTTLLFKKVIISNRLNLFIQYLNQHQIPVSNNYELLLLLSNPNTRQQLHHQFQIDPSILLLHAELADLIQIEMTELDAQLLLFSQRNYQNAFTGETINLKVLAESNAESLLENMTAWMEENQSPNLNNYRLSVQEVESWISQANDYSFKIFAQIY